MGGVLSSTNDIDLFLMMFTCMILNYELVSVQYREYENGISFFRL